ncbi:hypothetical protein SB48_HM08orf01265 [Heyndrickxia coagulans]|uniref:Uncharacterized protein n=1 Tax=Heyndrickxia coagulans TaxID=1398 RepID=A0AAN0T3E1_HEYCO|nr:hypothetical protein SB48_HM08orf01265 [Heyndrickxia coagulans]
MATLFYVKVHFLFPRSIYHIPNLHCAQSKKTAARKEAAVFTYKLIRSGVSAIPC